MFPLNRIATRLTAEPLQHEGMPSRATIGISESLLNAEGFAPGTLTLKPAGEPDCLSYITTGNDRMPTVVSLGMGGILKNYAIAGIVVWQDDQAYLLREHGLPTLRLTDGCKPIEGDVTLYGDVHSEHGRLTFKENGCAWEFQDAAHGNGPVAWNGEDIQ